ncbi:MAG: VWA domain-containing protein, partial [Puniceicoccales bacterium]|nr:VWA domain-containing protein [Puniceicoccales bacterium]
MKIGNPSFLFLLPLWIAIVLFLILWGRRRWSQRLGMLIAQRLSPLLLSTYSDKKQKLKNFLFLSAIASIGFALTAPQWGFKEEERYAQGIDVLIAVDVSKSMLAEDIKPNRLERTKLAVLDLIQFFAGHRLGLIAFSGNAFLQCPLTLDHNAFIQSLNAMDTDTIPVPGTAIHVAIELAAKVYGETQNQKLLFLFSDGEELADSAITGAHWAKEQNICIYTIGIGSAEGSTIPISVIENNVKKIKPLCDKNGQVIKTTLDEKTLREIAEISEGNYYHLSPIALTHLQRDILNQFPLLKTPSKDNKSIETVYQERYQYFLLLGFLLLILEMLIGTYKKPEQYTISIYYKLSLMIFALFFSMNRLSAKESDGEIHYKNGDFEKALAFYNQQLEKKPGNTELLYNKGTTCLALKQYEEAIDCLKKSTTNAPIALQKKSFYNLGNAFFERGSQCPDTKDVMEQWKESLRHFQSAIDLDEHFEEAKKNAKYVEEALKQLENQSQSSNSPSLEDKKDSDPSQSAQDQQKPEGQGQNASSSPEDKKDGNSSQGAQDQQKSEGQGQNASSSPEDKKDGDPSQGAQDQQKSEGQGQNASSSPEDKKDGDPSQRAQDQQKSEGQRQNASSSPEDKKDGYPSQRTQDQQKSEQQRQSASSSPEDKKD